MTRPVLFTPLSVTYSTCLPTRLSVSSPGLRSAGSRCLFSVKAKERNDVTKEITTGEASVVKHIDISRSSDAEKSETVPTQVPAVSDSVVK